MSLERLVGFSVFISILLALIFIFYPDENISDLEFPDNTNEISNYDNEISSFKNFSESDFDFYVYRAHVLSSQTKIEELVIQINNGGFPAFFESLESNKELFVLYVGPFLSENDIVDNMKVIQRLSESQSEEISRWKL
tara:strand:+ start:551 stop:964 length:414 start_codon:yes stop_codon:yes gene_type:complete